MRARPASTDRPGRPVEAAMATAPANLAPNWSAWADEDLVAHIQRTHAEEADLTLRARCSGVLRAVVARRRRLCNTWVLDVQVVKDLADRRLDGWAERE